MDLTTLFRAPPMDPLLKIVSGVPIFRECNRVELEALKELVVDLFLNYHLLNKQ